MRILFAITKGEVGGAQAHVRILARGMTAEGHRVAAAVQEPSDLAEALGALGVEVIPWHAITAGLAPAADVHARAELRRAVATWRPDVVHLHSSKAGVVGAGVLAPPAGATVFTCHHLPFGAGRLPVNRITTRPAMHLVLRRMQGVISVGTRDMAMISRLAPKVPLALVRNAVPIDEPPVAPSPPRPAALWVARMAHPKDPLAAASAWTRVLQRRPEATLTMCGTGPLEPALHRQVAADRIGHRLATPGAVADLRPLHSTSSVFLLASSAEGGISMATLEAMAHGLVPVVSDVGDAQLLDDHECGVRVTRAGPAPIADAVLELFDDPERMSRLRRNAEAFARARWTVDDMVRATLAFYRRVAP